MNILKLKVKSVIISIYVLMLSFFYILSAFSDESIDMGNWFMESGFYDEAATEFRRFLFFNISEESTDHVLYKLGLAYRAKQDWPKAINAFRESILATKDLDAADERRITLATTLIAKGDYNIARFELLNVSEYSKTLPLRQRSLYFRGIASLYMYDWDATIEAFNRFYAEDKNRIAEIESVILKTRRSYKSPRLARILSIILPGSGQIYSGDWRNGLNAMAINGINIGIMTNAIYKRNRVFIIIMPSIFYRYYVGNINRAQESTVKYNELINRQSVWKILNLVRLDEP